MLLYFPDWNLSDGAAEVAPNGFFDVQNAPPSDTWVALFDDGPGGDVNYGRYLVCYVPSFLLDVTDRGIEVNPEECILWLHKTNTAFTKRFGSNALLASGRRR